MIQKSDWSPEAYLKYGNERTQPSIDLVSRIKINYSPRNIIDIGCGPGNSGKILADRWPNARLLGIDSSPAMIEKAKADFPRHEWLLKDAATFSPEGTFDIVFSNATIPWIPNHETLLSRFCAMLSENGVLAFQTPLFRDMPVSEAIETVAQRMPWRAKTAACKALFTFHDFRFYYDIVASKLPAVELWETTYLHVVESRRSIIEWIKSTGMKPYLDSLSNDNEKMEFEKEVLEQLIPNYPQAKNGNVLFPFKRLFVIGYNA
jgi:trans-aconitate 2-methyltransferase